MLEEKFAKKLIELGTIVQISDMTLSENIRLADNSIGPFKIKFAKEFTKKEVIEDSFELVNAIVEGEGEVTGQNAQNLLNKLSNAFEQGDISWYEIAFFAGSVNGKSPKKCSYDALFIAENGEMRVDYQKSEQKEIIMSCEKGDGKHMVACKYLNVCPSYQAYKAGKKLQFEKE